jgi:hypothetical protein
MAAATAASIVLARDDKEVIERAVKKCTAEERDRWRIAVRRGTVKVPEPTGFGRRVS